MIIGAGIACVATALRGGVITGQELELDEFTGTPRDAAVEKYEDENGSDIKGRVTSDDDMLKLLSKIGEEEAKRCK